MGIYRDKLPQLGDKTFITDGGLETELIFHQARDLPQFAAYDLLRSEEGFETLYDYYKTYALLARQYSQGIVLETPTWRANADWACKLGDSPATLAALNRRAVQLIERIREEYASENTPIVISGCLGPRGDGYTPGETMSVVQAQAYHTEQVTIFADTEADMVAAFTMNYVEEAIGITLAAQEAGIPVCISFTVETDGRIPTGESLEEAIEAVDAATGGGPVYYMINCAHPTHFDHLFREGGGTLSRIRGLRGNASCKSHAELDESEVLDEGNPDAFGAELVELQGLAPQLTVLGGCCGTDHRHIEQVCINLS